MNVRFHYIKSLPSPESELLMENFVETIAVYLEVTVLLLCWSLIISTRVAKLSRQVNKRHGIYMCDGPKSAIIHETPVPS